MPKFQQGYLKKAQGNATTEPGTAFLQSRLILGWGRDGSKASEPGEEITVLGQR